MRRFEDRTAVVTGAASGIGRATAEALAERGCHVALVDIDRQGLDETAERVERLGRRVTLHVIDVADRDLMAALPGEVTREHGGVHIVVNNAGVSVAKEFAEHTLDDLEWIVGINFWGVVYGCKFFLPLLLEQDEAHIVNISSMFGFVGIPGQSSYCATKFAVRGLSEALHGELLRTAVGVTSVHPGAVQTRIVRAARTDDEEMRTLTEDWFVRLGSPPKRVARRIVAAIARRRLRVVVTPEARISEWFKRAFQVATQHVIARGYQRMQNQASDGSADGSS